MAQLRRFRRLVIVFYLENSFVFPVNTCPNHSLVEEGNAKNYAKTRNELVLSGIIFGMSNVIDVFQQEIYNFDLF